MSARCWEASDDVQNYYLCKVGRVSGQKEKLENLPSVSNKGMLSDSRVWIHLLLSQYSLSLSYPLGSRRGRRSIFINGSDATADEAAKSG